MESSSSNGSKMTVGGRDVGGECGSADALSLLVPTFDQWHESTMRGSQQQKAAANVTDCNRRGDHIGEDLSSAPKAIAPAPHLSNSAKMAQQFLGYKCQFPQLYRVGGGGIPGMSAKKRKRAAQLGLVPPPNKNAVVALNELRPGLEYVVAEEKGPIHQPTFVIKITVNGQDFTGEGRVVRETRHVPLFLSHGRMPKTLPF